MPFWWVFLGSCAFQNSSISQYSAYMLLWLNPAVRWPQTKVSTRSHQQAENNVREVNIEDNGSVWNVDWFLQANQYLQLQTHVVWEAWCIEIWRNFYRQIYICICRQILSGKIMAWCICTTGVSTFVSTLLVITCKKIRNGQNMSKKLPQTVM